MGSLIKNADAQEQGARTQSMVEHLINASLNSLQIQSKNSQHDESHMADTRVSHERFDVLLDQSHQTPIDNANESYNSQIRKELC